MNDALREAASVAPDWAKKEARRQIILKATVAGTLLALAVGTLAFVLGVHNSSQITNVHNDVTRIESPCQRFGPGSHRCKEAFESAVASINHRIACFIEHKAGDRVAKCVGVSLLVDVPASRGGDAIHQPSHKGHQHPSPSSGGEQVGAGKGNGGGHHGTPAPGHGGSGQPSEPASSGSGPSTSPGSSEASTSSPSPGNSGSSKANPIAEGTSNALEAVGGVVSEAGHSANEVVGETVEGAQGKTCGVAGVGC